MITREVIVERDARRPYRCAAGHTWDARGETTWNPWGAPDWRAKAAAELDCPTCGARGQRDG